MSKINSSKAENNNKEEKVMVLVASNNKGKIKEVKEILEGYEVISLKESGVNIDPEEDGKTFAENAIKKASSIGKVANMLTISDDSGIEIPELSNWPGVYTKRLDETGYGENMSDFDRNEFILGKCKDLKDRTVIWKTCIALYDPETERSEVFEGGIRGRLPEKQYGENGFGFDAIFELEGRHDTMASISAEEKNGISPRKIALSRLNEFLKSRK